MSLFSRYAARPEALSGISGRLSGAGVTIDQVGVTAAERAVPAAENVVGMLVRPFTVATHGVRRSSRSLSEASGFAASAVNLWIESVTDYDAEIDRLNAEYETARLTDFGVADVDEDAHADAVAGARSTMVSRLTVRKVVADDRLDEVGNDLARMLGRGPNSDDWETLGDSGVVPADFSAYVPGSAPGEPGGPEFVIGPPTRPDIEWDEGFEYDSASPNPGDYIAWAKWGAMLRGGQLLKPELDDSTQMYRHYRGNSGEHITFDYEEAYNEDEGVRTQIDEQLVRAQEGAEGIIADGHTSFSVTGDAQPPGGHYPSTENWQKTIGGHQTWTSADVEVDGDTVTMNVTVHGEDYYNFNPSQSDIATGASDDENGRFTELGWARPFESSGSITRTVTWTLGDPDTVETTESGSPGRNPGREDREDERESGDPDRPAVPDNDRGTGEYRGS